MHIAWIGGLTRSLDRYAEEAKRLGHALHTHDGVIGGKGTASLENVLLRADMIIALTEVNSHGAIGLARRASIEYGKPFFLLRKCGTARFRELMLSIAA